jgi:uncharacterized membrane protein YfcA
MRERAPFLPRHPDDYLKPSRRWAPILFLLVGAAAGIRIGGANGSGKATDWLFLLAGLATAAQGFDALRTGKLHGRFPNLWPVDAERGREPITFWWVTAVYLLLGMVFAAAGAGGIVASAWQWLTN